MTEQTIEQLEAESLKWVVAKVNGRDVTRGELVAAFDRVADPRNWKFAIDRVVSLTAEEKAMLAEAITFFTGSVGTFETRSEIGLLTTYRVKAAGYYQTIGA